METYNDNSMTERDNCYFHNLQILHNNTSKKLFRILNKKTSQDQHKWNERTQASIIHGKGTQLACFKLRQKHTEM